MVCLYACCLSGFMLDAVARIALVKPDKARGIENMVLQMAQRGQLTEKVGIIHHKASNNARDTVEALMSLCTHTGAVAADRCSGCCTNGSSRPHCTPFTLRQLCT